MTTNKASYSKTQAPGKAKDARSGHKKPTKADKQIICNNKRALHHLAISEHLEAGLVLVGTEVKACRLGKAHLNDAYVRVEADGAAWLFNAHIDEYTYGNRFNHRPLRARKLLLHQKEIAKLAVKLQEKGFSAVPLSLYFRRGRVKVDVGIGKGKKSFDKREIIKKRETARELARIAKHYQTR